MFLTLLFPSAISMELTEHLQELGTIELYGGGKCNSWVGILQILLQTQRETAAYGQTENSEIGVKTDRAE